MDRKNESSGLRKIAPIYNRFFKNLYWLLLPVILADIMTSDAMVRFVPGLFLPGMLLGVLCPVCYYMVLLRNSLREKLYRIAGALGIASVALGIAAAFVRGLLSVLFSVGSIACGLMVEYFEYKGHRITVSQSDRILAERWFKLFYLYFGLFALTLVGAGVGSYVPLVGVITAYISLCGMFVLQIIKMIYLSNSAAAFGNIR